MRRWSQADATGRSAADCAPLCGRVQPLSPMAFNSERRLASAAPLRLSVPDEQARTRIGAEMSGNLGS